VFSGLPIHDTADCQSALRRGRTRQRFFLSGPPGPRFFTLAALGIGRSFFICVHLCPSVVDFLFALQRFNAFPRPMKLDSPMAKATINTMTSSDTVVGILH